MSSADLPIRGQALFHWPGPGCREDRKLHQWSQLGRDPFDVVIVGAGVVGTALAFQLSRLPLRILVVDGRFDVGEGTSKGNSAIIHTGFDAQPNSLESALVTQASRLWPGLAAQLKVPLAPVGAILLALDAGQVRKLSDLGEKARRNSVDDIQELSAPDIQRLEPAASPSALGGLLVPRESIIDPFAVSIAFAELAVANGAQFVFGVRVAEVRDASQPVKKLVDQMGRCISARAIVNVAGLGARALSSTYQGDSFDINPRRGQFLVYDKDAGRMLQRMLLPVPSPATKGKLVTPTIFGNLLAGPTAEDLPLGAAAATSTTVEGLLEVRTAAEQLCPRLKDLLPIASYAGARCNCAQGSFQIRVGDGGNSGIVTVVGVRSTGLTASPALAEHLIDLLRGTLPIPDSAHWDALDRRPDGSWPTWWTRPWRDSRKVAANPDYARIVCFCEQVSRQEIVDALDSPLYPQTLDAIKRRTRALSGRCQGFNCQIPVAEIMANHLGVPLETVTKCGPGTSLLPCPQD